MTPLPTRALLLATLLSLGAPAWALEPFVELVGRTGPS